MHRIKKSHNFAAQKHDRGHAKQSKNQGEMAEWSIAAVLKTVEGHTSGGSNPSLSAVSNDKPAEFQRVFLFLAMYVHEFGHELTYF